LPLLKLLGRLALNQIAGVLSRLFREHGTALLLHRTRLGQHLYAIGGNREAAKYTGIPIARNEIAVYALCSLFAGLAGIIHSSQLYSAEPSSGQGLDSSGSQTLILTPFSSGPNPDPQINLFQVRDITSTLIPQTHDYQHRGQRPNPDNCG